MTNEQETKLKELGSLFLKSSEIINQGELEDYRGFDERRAAAVPPLKKMIDDFISERMSMLEFKESSESHCRKFPYWGFKSFSGQMQLNQFVNNISDNKRDGILRDSIRAPKNEAEAREKINVLADYLKGIKAAADNPKGIPRTSQGYFLSYFWEIQNMTRWPVYYGSSKKILLDMEFSLDSQESPGDEYLMFLAIVQEAIRLFEGQGHKAKYPFWFVEHVLWTQFMQATPGETSAPQKEKDGVKQELVSDSSSLGEWLPEIVRDLVDLSRNKETAWSRRQDVKPEKAFETKLRYAFTLLGYDTEELGQGKGREPDGVAKSMGMSEGHYAIVYDAKARESRFSIGTSDREICEYVLKKKDLLKRKYRIDKSYYVIISSDFDDRSVHEALRDIFKRTQVPITLLKASDLLFIINTKLQSVEIGHKELEDIFLDTGLITREKISSILGVR